SGDDRGGRRNVSRFPFPVTRAHWSRIRCRSAHPDPQDDREAARDVAGPHSSFLPDDRSGHGAGERGARGAQPAARRSGQSLVQRHHHQGDGARAHQASGLQRLVPGRPHPLLARGAYGDGGGGSGRAHHPRDPERGTRNSERGTAARASGHLFRVPRSDFRVGEGGLLASQFDVIILGGGPAGYVAAIRAAQLGMSTAVIEKEKLGGVCVNIGCIPTKALLHSAYIARLLRDAKEFGIEAGAVKTDYGVAMQRSRKVSDQNSKGVEFLMKKNKVTVVKGAGVLQPGRKVKVGNDGYEAKKAVLIATGSR